MITKAQASVSNHDDFNPGIICASVIMFYSGSYRGPIKIDIYIRHHRAKSARVPIWWGY